MNINKQKPFDKFAWGFVPAILLPIFSIFILYLFHQDKLHINSFFSYLAYITKYQLVSKVLSLTLLSNLLVFYLFVQTNKLKAVKGVLGATMVYGLFIILYVIIGKL